MKKYIREMINDLRGEKTNKDFIPPVPKSPTDGKIIDQDAEPQPALPDDLTRQVLSTNPAERTRQLDYQAQKNEERETS